MYTILPLTFERMDSLDMSYPFVDNCEHHTCGTIHCFGGWFAVACLNARLLKRGVYFSDGANKMAKILGFECRLFLEQWAARNPNIWGNSSGGGMFHLAIAFQDSVYRPFGAKSVSDIINHLEEVQARLPK